MKHEHEHEHEHETSWLEWFCQTSILPVLGSHDMALSTNGTLWSNSDVFNQTDPSLANDTDCKLPWEGFAEMHDSNIDIVNGIAILLILFFNTFLIGIILLHDHLRKKASGKNNIPTNWSVNLLTHPACALWLLLAKKLFEDNG